MVNIDFWKIYEVCHRNPIGYDQMGYIYPRIIKYITKDNQDTILSTIGILANKGLNKYQMVKEITDLFEK